MLPPTAGPPCKNCLGHRCALNGPSSSGCGVPCSSFFLTGLCSEGGIVGHTCRDRDPGREGLRESPCILAAFPFSPDAYPAPFSLRTPARAPGNTSPKHRGISICGASRCSAPSALDSACGELCSDSRSVGLGWGSPASLPDQSEGHMAQPGQLESR